MVQPLWKQSQCLKKLNVHLPYGQTISPLDNYSRKRKTYVHTKTCIKMLTVALLVIDEKRKQLKYLSFGRLVEKQIVYIDTMEYY